MRILKTVCILVVIGSVAVWGILAYQQNTWKPTPDVSKLPSLSSFGLGEKASTPEADEQMLIDTVVRDFGTIKVKFQTLLDENRQLRAENETLREIATADEKKAAALEKLKSLPAREARSE